MKNRVKKISIVLVVLLVICLSLASCSSGSGSSGGSASDTGEAVTNKDSAADTTAADHIAFAPYQAMDIQTLEWMLARQPLMGREFLKYLLNQKGSLPVAIPLAHVADMTTPIKVPIAGGGQYLLGYAVFTPSSEGDTTGYGFTIEPEPNIDLSNIRIFLGTDFEDLKRTLTDADYYKPDSFVPVSTLVLAQVDGAVAYDPAKASQFKVEPEVTNKITEWMALG